MKILLSALFALSLLVVEASAKKSDEVDYMGLAALMLKDGYYDRANDALSQVDVNDSKLDLPRFHMLKGMVLTKKTFYKEANENFYKSIELNPDKEMSKSLYLYIAQNSFKLKDYQGCINALDMVPAMMDANPKLFGLKAECYWRLDQKDNALDELRRVNTKFPEFWDAYKQRFYYLVSIKLYQAALEDAQIYLKNAEPNETITIAFINALRQAGQTDRAIELAEVANLRYLKSSKITVLLGHLYLDKDKVNAAAKIFDEASVEDGNYTKESAEMYRRAGDFVMALYKNAQMLDAKEKYKQRIAIFLEYSQFERVVATRSAMQRSGLMEDESMRYALAYSYYMIGQFEPCEALLKTLTKSDLFKKATELRKKMEKCNANIWECEN